MKHIHHVIPKSKNGSNDPANLVELDFIEHAKLHAIDFLNGGIQFDFRHKGWLYLENELKNLVIQEASKRGKTKNYLTEEGRIKGGKTQGQICKKLKKGVCGQSLEKMRENGRKGGVKGGKTQGLLNALNKTGFCNPEVQSLNAKKLNSLKVRCKITGHISTPGGLSRYQQSRGIDHTNPNNREQIK